MSKKVQPLQTLPICQSPCTVFACPTSILILFIILYYQQLGIFIKVFKIEGVITVIFLTPWTTKSIAYTTELYKTIQEISLSWGFDLIYHGGKMEPWKPWLCNQCCRWHHPSLKQESKQGSFVLVVMIKVTTIFPTQWLVFLPSDNIIF